MSSNEDELDDSAHSKRRRLVTRACDLCRRKKIRCDGPQMPGNRCSSCVAYGFECTYIEAARKRGPPKGYIESIENRIQKIERLLQTLLPEADLAQVLADSSAANWQNPAILDEDERAHLSLIENIQRLSLSPDNDTRFFGRSSGAMLLQTALNVKLDTEPQNAQRHTEFWASRPSPQATPKPQYTFPPPDLAASLVDLYFANVNLLLPLLHRPTFEGDLAGGLHLRNDGFAATYLLVCAVGARYSLDPRVLLDGTDSLHSCGWRWFDQLQLMRDPLGPPVCLYDLQLSALAVLFIHSTSGPQASWILVSNGIRMAQDVGAHRRKQPVQQSTAEDELWKRAFWVLVFLDRLTSAQFGRPCALQDEDFDLDLPIDCDDEYWDSPDSEMAFQQPRGKPSRISAFIALLRLCQVLSFTLRTLYSIKKSKALLGLTKGNNDWEQRIVVELDSALDKWVDGLPDHLRWNPAQEQADFFDQSATLYSTYYHVQIIIHRPDIPSPNKNTPWPYQSLAKCLNAARSCIRVVDIHRRRREHKPMPFAHVALFTSGVMLLLNIWAGKHGGTGLSIDSSQEMAEVHRCMQTLQCIENRWTWAGRLKDILYDLSSAGRLPLPASSNMTNKRERGAEQPKSASASHPEIEPTSGSSDNTDGKGARAGRRRPTIDVSSIRPVVSNSSSVSTERLFAGGHRLHTSDVPALTTHFLPPALRGREYGPDTPISAASAHSQPHDGFRSAHGEDSHRRPYAPGPNTPLSATSLRSHPSDASMPPMHREEVHSRRFGPGTPLSATSPHPSRLQDMFASSLPRREEHLSHHSHVRTHLPPDTPLSASSIHSQQNPFVPSTTMQERADFPHSPVLFGDRGTGAGPGQEHWYRYDGPATSPAQAVHGSIHPHPHSASSGGNSESGPTQTSVPGSALSSTFPIAEAFYEHLTESFSNAASNHHLGHPPTQSHVGYTAGGTDGRHRVPSFVHGAPDTAHSQLGRDPRGGEIASHGVPDQDTMAHWSASAPMGYGVEDWPHTWTA